jgi:hypothetical protein
MPRLNERAFMSNTDEEVGSRIFSSPLVQTGFGAHTASYAMGTGGFSRGARTDGECT